MMTALAREVHALDPNLAPLITERLQDQIDVISYSQRLAVSACCNLRRDGAVSRCDRPLRGCVVHCFPRNARARFTHGSRRRHKRSHAPGNVTRTAPDCFRRRHWRLAAIMLTRLMGNMLYKISPHDPLAFGIGIRGDHDCFAGCLFFPRLARDTHRSGPSPARTMMN